MGREREGGREGGREEWEGGKVNRERRGIDSRDGGREREEEVKRREEREEGESLQQPTPHLTWVPD